MILNSSNTKNDIQVMAIADESRDAVLGEFVTLASQLLGIPSGFISILDEEHQYIQAANKFMTGKLKRDSTLCRLVVDSGQPVIIRDTILDPRSATHPLVKGVPFIRFYAGVPLIDNEGNIPGTLCVVDTAPHTFTRLHLTR